MDQQITNIAIKIGELQQQSSSAFHQSWLAIAVAIIGFFGTVIAASITASLYRKLHQQQKEHEKQWAYIGKRSLLIDQAIEVCSRMMFNKLLVIHHNNADAAVNLFVLQKDALVIESQLVVYGSLELADAFANFKDTITNTPNDQFLQKWTEIYNKGHECLLKCRKTLGSDISENFKEFSGKLTVQPPSKEELKFLKADTMGGVHPTV